MVASTSHTLPPMQVSDLVTDTRKISNPESSVFFALNGPARSGAAFAEEAYQAGIKIFVLPEDISLPQHADAIVINTPNVLTLLQQVAQWHRKKFKIPVIGITGSNGKTIIKELLYQLLHQRFGIVRSPKSYNSQLGVALSVWEMAQHHDLAIFEAGISKPGEMRQLQQMIAPTIGILSFIGQAHAVGFSNKEQKIEEKLKLFAQSQILFYPSDDDVVQQAVTRFATETNKNLQLFSWGKNDGATLQVLNIKSTQATASITLKYRQDEFVIKIPFSDDAFIHNCITSCCVLLYMHFDAFSIQKHMALLEPLEMRLQVKTGINQCLIINDAYSADIDSLKIALHFLKSQKAHAHKTIILSDLLQSGQAPELLYPLIAKLVKQAGVSKLIGIGMQMSRFKTVFSAIPAVEMYYSTDEFLKTYHAASFQNETILIKGARIFSLERISNLLVKQIHQTVLEIHLDALRHNLNVYKSLLPNHIRMMVMVKAFGYGSGGYEVANLLQSSGIHYLAVAYSDEAITLRNAGISLPIMVLNVDETVFEALLKYKLEPEIFSQALLQDFFQFLQSKNITNYPVHLKFDTGMHRLGFAADELEPLIKSLNNSKSIKVASAFTHLAASDDAVHDNFTNLQINTFSAIAENLKHALQYEFLTHVANTAGISRFKPQNTSMVRLGIGIYGVDSNNNLQQLLQTVTTLKTSISQIKFVKKGSSVGYGRQFILEEDAVIAIVRIGYADGYRRSLGNGKAYMLINGQKAYTIGNVCMDMTMLNITGLQVNETDEVLVFGEMLPVSLLAKWADTIPYEILTAVSARVPRVYYQHES